MKTIRRFDRFLRRYGPWAVVTGASSGIGTEMAVELARRGLNLVLVARRGELLANLARELEMQHGVQTRVLPLDLARRENLARLAAQTADLEIGLLVACAGFGTSGAFVEASLENELEMLDVNCAASAAMTWHFGRRMVAQGRGGLVLMGSIVGYQGTPHAAHYAATKAYIQTLAEGLHAELSSQGVDVVACAPGPVATGFADRANLRMGAAARPIEVARGGLDALGRRGTAVPGALAKLLTWSLAPLPRWARTRIMGSVMKGMTGHQSAPDRPITPTTAR